VGSYRVTVERSPAAADVALLEAKVAAAAANAAGLGEEEEFAVFVRGEDGAVVAGICGVVVGSYCELEALWVDEALRERGWARALLAEAEEEARRRGCVLVTFHAYDLLTARLYERLGYRTVGVVESCLAGSAIRWYCKDLDRPPSVT